MGFVEKKCLPIEVPKEKLQAKECDNGKSQTFSTELWIATHMETTWSTHLNYLFPPTKHYALTLLL